MIVYFNLKKDWHLGKIWTMGNFNLLMCLQVEIEMRIIPILSEDS